MLSIYTVLLFLLKIGGIGDFTVQYTTTLLKRSTEVTLLVQVSADERPDFNLQY